MIIKFKEFLNENRFQKRNEERYKSCLLSDLTRMELIETFFSKTQNNSEYNINKPDLSKLIDDWDGYDDQVYIQNVNQNEFIYWEGWVDACWNALYQKPEYKELSKDESINKVIKERFPRIGEEFGYIIKGYDYFLYEGEYIMKVTFTKES